MGQGYLEEATTSGASAVGGAKKKQDLQSMLLR